VFKLALPTALALVAGSSVVIQQVLNANLRAQLNSAIWSGFISYAV
jgi:transporter family-2 protein